RVSSSTPPRSTRATSRPRPVVRDRRRWARPDRGAVVLRVVRLRLTANVPYQWGMAMQIGKSISPALQQTAQAYASGQWILDKDAATRFVKELMEDANFSAEHIELAAEVVRAAPNDAATAYGRLVLDTFVLVARGELKRNDGEPENLVRLLPARPS